MGLICFKQNLLVEQNKKTFRKGHLKHDKRFSSSTNYKALP